MKNKILAMLLVVVSLVLTLTGCAYNYEKKDLSEYATFTLADFRAALEAVHVEDGEFALGKEDVRNAKVAEEIYNRIVKSLDKEDRVATGTVGATDILYYCYYLEATFEEGEGENKTEKKYYFYAADMKLSNLSQLALKNELEDKVDQLIKDKILAFDGENAFVFDGQAYDPIVKNETPEKVPAGVIVDVTYTEAVNGGTPTEKKNQKVDLKDAAEGSFAAFLVDKAVGKLLETGEGDAKTTLTFTEGDKVYDKITVNKVITPAPATGLAFVTYTFTTKEGNKSTTYTNGLVSLADTAFGQWLAGKEIGNTLKDGSTDLSFNGEDGTYSKITINWVVNADATEFTVTPEENPFKDATGTVTATDGTKQELKKAKDGSLVYHVYPVGRQEVSELTAETAKLLLTNIYGDTLVADALDCMKKDSGWKYTKKEEGKDDVERTLHTIFDELVGKYSDLKKAKDNLSANKDDTKKAELQKKVEEAEAAVNDEALDKVWAEVILCKKDGEEKKIEEVLVEEYNKTVYETLEDAYNKDIKDKVVKELWKIINDSVKVNSVPNKALKDAYKHNVSAYKYKFYTETIDGTEKGKPIKEQYDGDVRAYLIATAQDVAKELKDQGLTVSAPADGDYKAACEVLKLEAEQQVKEQIKVWVVMKEMDAAIEELDVSVTNSEIDSFAYMQALLSYYYYGVSISEDMIIEGYGKENVRTALAFDKLMAYLTETQAEEKEGDTVKVEADDSKFLNITVIRDEPKDDEAEKE